MKLQTGKKISILRSDNRGEYKSDSFLQLYRDEGIERHFTVKDTPQQNGMAEKLNCALLEKIRYLLSNSGLKKTFRAEALTYVSHLINRLPSSAIGGKTSMGIWSGKAALDYDTLKVFGCPSYYHVNDGKLEPRVRKVVFLEFKRGVIRYKLSRPASQNMRKRSRDEGRRHMYARKITTHIR